MDILALLNLDNPNLIPFITRMAGPQLASGFNGQVYPLAHDSTRLIKLTSLYETDKYHKIKIGLDFLMKNKLKNFVPLHEHGMISWLEDKYIIHYYIMDRLNPLTDDEKKVFHSLISHEDRNLKKASNLSEAQLLLTSLSKGLDFDFEKVLRFYQLLIESPIVHHDLHERNVMKNNNGDFALVDLDNIQLLEN